MNKLISVKPLEDYILELTYNEELRIFDLKPYLEKGFFSELKKVNYFNQVFLSFDSIAWPNGQDLSPETLLIKSVPIEVINS